MDSGRPVTLARWRTLVGQIDVALGEYTMPDGYCRGLVRSPLSSLLYPERINLDAVAKHLGT